MAKRAHNCMCRQTRGIATRTCVDCKVIIGKVMYDRCRQCEDNHYDRPRQPDLVYRPPVPWYGLIRT